MKTHLTCPRRGHLVEVELHRDPVDGHIIGVERCSAFTPDNWVDCDQLCAKLLNERCANRDAAREKDEP